MQIVEAQFLQVWVLATRRLCFMLFVLENRMRETVIGVVNVEKGLVTLDPCSRLLDASCSHRSCMSPKEENQKAK